MIMLDMKMPECCYECPFSREDSQLRDYCNIIDTGESRIWHGNERLGNCPVKEISDKGDFISREDALAPYVSLADDDVISVALIKRNILDLKAVHSGKEKGHWIREESICGWDGHSYQCSVCGRSIHLDTEVEDLEDYPFCHCGTKMIESEV